MLPLLMATYLHKLLEILLHGILVSSLSFINLFNDLFILVQTHVFCVFCGVFVCLFY